MLLVDTSIWIEHFRRGQPELGKALEGGAVLMHPWIAGELACGNLRNRATILSYLLALPQAAVASDHEVFRLVGDQKLWGRGLGWIDVHLLASAMLSRCRLWTLDRRLKEAATELLVG